MATHIKEIVGEFMLRKAREADDFSRADKIISSCLGEIRSDVVFEGVRGGCVFLRCGSSGVAYAVKLLVEEMLAELQGEMAGIKKVKIEVGDRGARSEA